MEASSLTKSMADAQPVLLKSLLEDTREGATKEDLLLEGLLPEGLLPEGLLPEGLLPEGLLPEGLPVLRIMEVNSLEKRMEDVLQAL